MSKVIGAPPEMHSLISLPGTFQHVLSLRLWSLNRTKAEKPARFPLHTHEYYEIIVPLLGSYSCSLNASPVEGLEQGSYLFIQPGDAHEDFYAPGVEFLAVLFSLRDMASGRWPGKVIDPALPTSSRAFSLKTGSRAETLMRLVASADPDKACDPVNVLSLEALCEAFFWGLFFEIPNSLLSREFSKCLGEDEFRIKATNYFGSALGQGLDLDRMASALGMSRRSLGYKFNSIFGSSPAKVFMAWRIGKAASLIENGLSVKDAAASMGFADQFHFSKAFKRELGFPPSEMGRKDR